MKNYKKSYLIQCLVSTVGNVVPFLPFICVLIAMDRNTPIEKKDKSIWIMMLFIAFVFLPVLTYAFIKFRSWITAKFQNSCAENIVTPLFPHDYSRINIIADQTIEETDVSVLFQKKPDRFSDWNYTNYSSLSGSWLVNGEYREKSFSCSNLTLYKKGSRGTKVKGYYGCYFIVDIRTIESWNPDDFRERLNWENPFESGFWTKNKGKCYCTAENGKLYIGLDCRRVLFKPISDQSEYIRQCTEDIAFITRVLNAALPDS